MEGFGKMKKTGKKIFIICMVLCIVAGICGCTYLYSKEETALKENQRYAYAYITSVQGNEVTYVEVDESLVVSEEDTENNEKSEKSKDSSEESNTEEKQADSDDTAENKAGGQSSDSFGGERPSGGEAPSGDFEMPSGGEAPSGDFEMPSGGEAPSGDFEMPSDGEKSSSDSSRGGKDNMFSMMGTETVTTYIPVGVTVHTADDKKTTFSRLYSGDIVKMLLETNADGEEVIVEIWMME